MTEEEWLTSGNPGAMIRFASNHSSVRKRRLFAVACCGRVGNMLDDYCRGLLIRAESAADRPVSSAEHNDLINDLMAHADGLSYRMGTPSGCARWYVASAVWCAADGDNAIGAADCIANAVQTAKLDPLTFDVTRPGPPLTGDPVERVAQAALLRCIFGNPFRPVMADPAWLTSTVTALARGIYADRAFDRLPILADALQDAGCDHAGILAHCRGAGPHARGCWVVDLILGKS
jgi:hypothetical protein